MTDPANLANDYGPDWETIRDSLAHMAALSADGWWGNWAYDDIEFETMMQTFGVTVGHETGEMLADNYKTNSVTIRLLRDMGQYLTWYAAIMVPDGDDDLRAEVELVRSKTLALARRIDQG